jgi:peptidoglycan/xylan/chitin deacetylase (PgdA/CDA1 family)
MKRGVIAMAGGGVVVLLLAAYGIVQAGWWTYVPPPPGAKQSAAPAAAASAQAAQPIVASPPQQVTVAQAPPAPQPVRPAGTVVAAALPVAASPQQAPPPVMAQPPAAPAANAPAKTSAKGTAWVQRPITCANPNAMGVSRVVEIDTTGGPGFGFQHFKTYDFLRDHEVVLTFDDGPWLGHTPLVLKALADQCLRATFFPIGKHATYYPEILKQVMAAGHTVGSHTWSHADLQAIMKKSGFDAAKEEMEKGASAVRMMADAPIAPFFRFPDLRHPPEMLTYLGERNIATFSTDIDSWDFKIKKPEELIKSLMGKLQKAGKAIILMHDFQKVTSIALPQILGQLQKNGFKVVHMVPKIQLATLPEFDEAVLKENKLQTLSNRPTESVVKTLNE